MHAQARAMRLNFRGDVCHAIKPFLDSSARSRRGASRRHTSAAGSTASTLAAHLDERCGLESPSGLQKPLVSPYSGAALLTSTPPPFRGEFELGEQLGQGSYGTVHACTHSSSGRQYAVKILQRRRGNDDRTPAAMREACVWSVLAGAPGVVQLRGVFQDAGAVYLLQELLPGGDLQALLDASQGGALTEPEAAAAMAALLAALASVHSAGVVYGDVKPGNLLLRRVYPCVAHALDPSAPRGPLDLALVDFGCAQHCPDGCDAAGGSSGSGSRGLSGTPAYMAPEVITQRRASAASDVWSAGVVAYQLLTGQFPFWDAPVSYLTRIHPRRVLQDITGGQLLLDAPCVRALQPAAAAFLKELLVHDPEARASARAALSHPWLASAAPDAAAAAASALAAWDEELRARRAAAAAAAAGGGTTGAAAAAAAAAQPAAGCDGTASDCGAASLWM